MLIRRRSYRPIVFLALLASLALPVRDSVAVEPDPCSAGSTDPSCATAALNASSCTAIGVHTRGLLPNTTSRSNANSPAGPAHDEKHAVSQDLGFVKASAVNSSCDASGSPLPNAMGSADVAAYAVDLTSLGVPVQVSGDLLRGSASSSTTTGLREATLTSIVAGVAGVPLALNPAAGPNTVVPLGSFGYLALNEQWSSGGDCRRDTNIALRIKINSPSLEIRIGWVSTMACKQSSTVTTQTIPAGTLPPGTSVTDSATVSGAGPTPTGSVTFFLCTPSQVTAAGCPTGTQVGTLKTLGAGGTALSDASSATTGLGEYCWRAEYSGDAFYARSSHTNRTTECFRIERQPVQITSLSQPTGGGVVPGSLVTDTATVTGAGPVPTGSVRFFLCLPPTVTANGGDCGAGGLLKSTKALVGGSATSAPSGDTFAIGTHCWRAEYLGDGYYLPANHTNSTTECFTTVMQAPQIRTDSRPTGPGVAPGTSAVDDVVVSGPSSIPSGTVTFFLCTPAQVTPAGCPSGGTQVGVAKTLSATGTATSDSSTGFVDTKPEGTYCWRVAYAGNAVYVPGVHTNATTECFTVAKKTSAMTTDSTPTGANIPPGTPSTDKATVTGSGPVPSGTVTFYLCRPYEITAAGCPLGGTQAGPAGMLVGGIATSEPSTAYVDTKPEGKYCWRAEYSGDFFYLPVTHTNASTECFTIERQMSTTATTSTPTGGNVPPGTAATDKATVTGGGPVPTGRITFFLCRPVELEHTVCAVGGTQVGAAKTLAGGSATSDPSTGFVDTRPEGTYCWRADYSGDTYYAPSSHSNETTECFTVVRQPSTTATTSTPTGGNVPPGTAATDKATVTGGGPVPTGTVTFFLCKPAEVTATGCPSGGVQVGVSKTLAGGSATSDPSTGFVDTRPEGTYCWRAAYNGDTYYTPSTDTNATTECFTVAKQTAGMSTTSNPTGGGINPGVSASDSATLTGGGPVPTGTLTFFLCKPGESTAGGCTLGTQIGAIKTVTVTGNASSDPTTNTGFVGLFCWRAVYSGDFYYATATHTNGTTECFTTVKQTPAVTTTASPSSVDHPATVTDLATVSPVAPLPTPTGTVRFFVCFPAEVTAAGCPAGGFAWQTLALNGAGQTTSGWPTISTDPPGKYCWRAEYSGDGNYTARTHTNATTECFVLRATPGVTTTASPSSVDHPATVTDLATVSQAAGLPMPTGTVRFFVCFPADVTAAGCPSGGFAWQTLALNGAGQTTSSWPTIASDPPGKYCWRAEYLGDSNYKPTTHTNATTECFILRGFANMSTTSQPQGANSVHVNTTAKDVATVSAAGGLPAPTGQVRFFLCGPTASPASCTTGGVLVGATKTLSGGSATSDNYLANSGVNQWFCWRAEYLGDTNYRPTSHSNSTSECFQVWELV